MTIAEKVEKDLVAAMKAREQLKLSVLRMAKTSLKHKQIEVGAPLNDDQAIAVLRTLLKQRRDSVEQFRKGGREDLATKEEAETEILQAYLPAEAGEDEISAAVAAAIQETGAAGPQDLGKVMKAAMQKLAGKNADGKRVNQIVRAKLGG
ncbi:MAG TPA: GatB/YqeY domain-containing protein [Terriglobia bacterium]|nr:GatB/YqeY domain-containing protein [Terriglobia bacterium]